MCISVMILSLPSLSSPTPDQLFTCLSIEGTIQLGKVEHPFLYVKRRFGYAKVRYRGLTKNTQRLALLLGFANPRLREGRL